jgi:hypothetical protein
MLLASLTESIAAVCPIFGVSGDRNSLRIDYRPEATAEQRAAAEAVAAAFDWDAPIAPTEVTKWQFWVVATERFGARGITKATVRAMLPQLITEPVALALAYVDYDDAATVRRDNPLLPLISGVYGVTEDELDALFLEAAGR